MSFTPSFPPAYNIGRQAAQKQLEAPPVSMPKKVEAKETMKEHIQKMLDRVVEETPLTMLNMSTDAIYRMMMAALKAKIGI